MWTVPPVSVSWCISCSYVHIKLYFNIDMIQNYIQNSEINQSTVYHKVSYFHNTGCLVISVATYMSIASYSNLRNFNICID